MQKKFKIEVDCANCAAKIETAVRNIPGVRNASVSFMAQKMLLDADDERFQDILQQATEKTLETFPIFRRVPAVVRAAGGLAGALPGHRL